MQNLISNLFLSSVNLFFFIFYKKSFKILNRNLNSFFKNKEAVKIVTKSSLRVRQQVTPKEIDGRKVEGNILSMALILCALFHLF